LIFKLDAYANWMPNSKADEDAKEEEEFAIEMEKDKRR